jgi:hypothetical protein
MGILLDRVEVDNNLKKIDVATAFKQNSLFFFEKYKSSDKGVRFIPLRDITLGGFYFLHYKDESNWMQYSPVFTIEHKKFEDRIVLLALNFNFIPIELRVRLFDPYMNRDDFEKNRDLVVDYPGIYNKLLSIGFEYSIVEYNMAQVMFSHRISNDLVPRFLYSQHPINIYDPKKLYQIMLAKIGDQKLRDEQIRKLAVDQLYKEVSQEGFDLDQLAGRFERIQRNLRKFNQ